MEELVLYRRANSGEQNPMNRLMTALEAVTNRGVKIYESVATGAQHFYYFTTTSKEVHLFLGAMGQDGLWFLGRVLDGEFKTKVCNELIVYPSQNDRKEAIYAVLLASDDKSTRIQLSPAR